MASTIEFGPDSQPTSARLDLNTGDRPSVLVALTPRRVTVRTVTPRGESARQYPALARTLLLDEFLVSQFVLLPSRREGDVAMVDPRTGLRSIVPLRDSGMESVEVRGVERELHHLVLAEGAETRHLWYDETGRLIMVEVPADGITAIRLPKP
jgi:hypothetical protein